MNQPDAHDRPSLTVVPRLQAWPTPARDPMRAPRASMSERPNLLTVTHRDEGSVWVVELAGEADLSTQSTVERALNLALTHHRTAVVVDVSRLTFCDSTCVSALLDANREGCLVLAGDQGIVSRVFDLLDPDQQIARKA